MEANMEIEYKFWAGNVSKEQFHSILETAIEKQYEPMYVCSCDELTLKQKREGNVVRKEINLNMSNNDDSSVVEFLMLSGYEKVFSVFKEAWIWEFEDCDVSYYTLSDGRSVVELEATPESFSTTEEGIAIIDKWSKKLSCDSLQREFRSLFEIFTEEANRVCSARQCADESGTNECC